MDQQSTFGGHGIVLPPPPAPVANYVTSRRVGPLLFVSGQGPREASGLLHTGKVGADVDAAAAYHHARLAGLNLLAIVKNALGDLGRVEFVVKLFGMVNAVPDFGDHPKVINGCSDLFTEVFGDAGRHARSAVGVGSLPGGMTVEVEAIFAVRD